MMYNGVVEEWGEGGLLVWSNGEWDYAIDGFDRFKIRGRKNYLLLCQANSVIEKFVIHFTMGMVFGI